MNKKTILLFALAACLVLTSVALAGKPPPGKATDPNPADSATGVDINADLSWTAGSQTDSHNVYFGTTSPGTFQVNQEDTTWDPGTMAENTPYYWRIDEVGGGGTTTGDVWSFTTEEAPSPPAAPSALGATAVSSSQIDLGWTDNADNEDGFKIESKTTGAFEQIDTVGADVTTYNDTGLSASTTYTYRVRAYNGAGDSAYSNEASDTTFEPSGGDCYVATDGNDNNPGTLAQPFATIQKAADVMVAGDTCYIRGGSYHETVTMQSKNGTAANPITFTNYQDEVVELNGTEEITSSWTQHSGNIYKTTLSADVWQLFVDDDMVLSARWPNNSLATLWDTDDTWGWSSSQSSDGHMYDSPHDGIDLTDLSFSVQGAMAVLNVGHWKSWARVVNSHNSGSNNFTYDAIGDDFKTDPENHHYFIECKLQLLDAENEWFYDDGTSTLYLWAPGGGNPSSKTVEGKTLDYAFDINDCDYINITGLDFFATTFALNLCQHVTVEDCDFLYPSYSKRMIGDLTDTEITLLGYDYGEDANDPDQAGGFNTVRNCTFAYSDGPAMEIAGLANTVENCLLHHMDYTSVVYCDNAKTVRSFNGKGTIFRRNTAHTCGNTSFYRGSWFPSPDAYKSIIELNHLYNIGTLGADGASIQMGVAAENSIIRYNWTHDHRKYGYRYDGKYELDRYGVHGLNHHNLAWDLGNCGYRIKGDYHETYNNHAINCAYVDIPIRGVGGGNTHSITRNNAAYEIAGSKSDPTEPIPGTKSNNWIGYDLSEDIQDQLMDPNPDHLDFRPKVGSDLIDAGYVISGITDGYNGEAPDIGAYESGDTNYWIPGRQEADATIPVPPDGTTFVTPEDLMWLGGYGDTSFDVYFGTNSNPPFQSTQSNNIYDPGALDANTTYYWKIDSGDVWSFTTGEGAGGGQWEFNPTDDTFVNSGQPSNNYGTRSTLRLKVDKKYDYYKFTVSGTSGTVTSATLKLKTYTPEPPIDTYVYAVTGDWGEMTLTWNNDDLVWGDLLDSGSSFLESTWYEFDVSGSVTGNGTYTFGLKTTSDTEGRWYSKEQGDAVPVLTVVTE